MQVYAWTGIPALDLWDSVIEVFQSSPNQTNKTKDVRESQGNLSANTQPNMRKQIPTTKSNLNLTNISHALLYVFEDSEAVIKKIIKGRSPTMRHVSRTHRVALDWLINRINLDSKNQIRYIDTKHQLADISTKGNFTRGEWNHLTTWRPYGRFGREYGNLGIFLNTTLRAAVHLGKDHDANLHHVKNNLWNSVGQPFRETEKLISEQKESLV